MTVQPAKPTEPSTGTDTWPSVASVLAWVVYFGSLVTIYLVAYHRHNLTCQRAAVWGLSISLAAAVLAFLVTLGRPGSRLGFRLRRLSVSLAIVGILLVAASVAVIWVAVNLTLRNQPDGAWALTVPASAAPLVLLVSPAYRRLIPGETQMIPGEAQTLAPGLPGTAVAGTASPEARVIDQERLTEEAVRQAEEAARIAAEERAAQLADEERLAEEARLAETARLAEARLAEEARLAREARRRPVALLDPQWGSRLGHPAPAVALDSGFWRMTLQELAGHDAEQGGVALIVRFEDVLVVFGAVFPVQLKATSVYCEFSTEDVIRVRRALDQVAPQIGLADGDVTVTWVHTHPHMGPFLSGTDRETARSWRALDPHFTPIVLDAYGRSLERQIGVFDAACDQITPIDIVDGLVNESVTPQLTGALRRSYRADGLPEPLVLIPGGGGRRGARQADRRNYR